MTERLGDITRRIASVQELDAVIAAMRGIAASRTQLCRIRLPAVLAYEKVISQAIAAALPFMPDATSPGSARAPAGHALVLFGAEQGFAGAFTERVLAEAPKALGSAQLLLLGTRAAIVVEEHGLPITWRSAMPSHPDAVAATANRISEVLYERIAEDAIGQVSLVFPIWNQEGTLKVETRAVLPFDFQRLVTNAGDVSTTQQPLLTLSPQLLLARLVEEYVFAELCAAALEAIAAENEARIAAMLGASRNVDRMSAALHALERRTRQDEITAEVAELARGLASP